MDPKRYHILVHVYCVCIYIYVALYSMILFHQQDKTVVWVIEGWETTQLHFRIILYKTFVQSQFGGSSSVVLSVIDQLQQIGILFFCDVSGAHSLQTLLHLWTNCEVIL